MHKKTINSFYKSLSEKEKNVLKEKPYITVYFNFFDDCREYLSLEDTGILFISILHYATNYGFLPRELDEALADNRILDFMFSKWVQILQKDAKTYLSKELNKKGKRKKTDKNLLYVKKDFYLNLIGNEKNFPKSTRDLGLNDEELIEFIEFGNKNHWNESWEQLLREFSGLS